MKILLQILFFLLTWFTSFANTTLSFSKVVLPSYEVTFSKTENVKEENLVKIGTQNFARSGLEENLFSQKSTSRERYALVGASRAGECKVAQGAGNWITAFPKLASKKSAWSHLELVFEGVDDYVRILSKNGDEVAKVFKNGTDEVFEISDDFFRATPSNPVSFPITRNGAGNDSQIEFKNNTFGGWW